MHVITIAGLWILIQVVPLIVMFVIYFFFAQQNFFQIEGLWKGIIASGPIAAYIFLTWIGFRYFKDLAATFDPQDDYRDILGSWELVSQSEKSTQATGRCEITCPNKRLSLSGTFEEGANPTVVWQSDFAFLDGNRLFYVYKLDAGPDSFIGYVRLHVKRPSRRAYKGVEDMVGDWVALGAQRKRGRISFKRVA
jgi:hypothetical protein